MLSHDGKYLLVEKFKTFRSQSAPLISKSLLRLTVLFSEKFFEVLNSDCFLNTVVLHAWVSVRCADTVQYSLCNPSASYPTHDSHMYTQNGKQVVKGREV